MAGPKVSTPTIGGGYRPAGCIGFVPASLSICQMALHVGCIGVEPQSVAVRCALQFSSMHMCGVPDCCGILV
jgi:hypothetical protein